MKNVLRSVLPGLLAVILLALPWVARADAFDDELLAIQTRWAEIQYQTAEKEKADAFEILRHTAKIDRAKKYGFYFAKQQVYI